MRTKTLVTVLLAGFVLVAFGVIALKPSPPAQTRNPEAKARSMPRRAPVAVQDSEPSSSAPISSTASVSQPLELSHPSKPTKSEGSAVKEPEAANAVPTTQAVPPASPSKHSRRVVATYFHGNVRCPTCRKVESYAREAVEEGFQPQVAAGTVEFRAVNTDETQNVHFVEDYELINKSVVVTEELDGKVARWVKLDEVWSLVGKREAYQHYVQDAGRGYLESE